MHSIAQTQKDPGIHVLDGWMPAAKAHPAMHHPRRRNGTTSMVGFKKTVTYAKISPKRVNPRDIDSCGTQMKKNPSTLQVSSFQLCSGWHHNTQTGPSAFHPFSPQPPYGCPPNITMLVWLKTGCPWSQGTKCQPISFSSPPPLPPSLRHCSWCHVTEHLPHPFCCFFSFSFRMRFFFPVLGWEWW